MLKPVAVATKRNALLDLLLDPAPGVTMVNHG
jgi:hypothetical protein